MPTHQRDEAMTLEEARERISARIFVPDVEASEAGHVGLEPELFVFQLDAQGRPTGRVPLESEGGVTDGVDAVARFDGRFRRSLGGPPPVYDLAQGGRITFEPGGQLEHSTAVHASAAAAMDDVECTAVALVRGFGSCDRVLAACGLDLWFDVMDVPQQLRAPRYCAMAEYFARRGPEGAIMMRHTASMQVNLDLGRPEVASARYAISNLASPVACASFATSPAEGAVSRRARAWQGLDPTRTGFPASFLAGSGDSPGLQYADFALDADVMLFLRADGSAVPGHEGFSLRRWILEGHPTFAWPTAADVEYHLTTLFPEVRLRGFLELRSGDALPTRWRGAAVAFWTGLVYDGRARAAALELLEPERAGLHGLWERAAEQGLADARLRELARELWTLALEGAQRLPAGFLRPLDLDCARGYRERFIAEGSSPAHELAAAHRRDPAESLAWAREEARCADLARE